MKTLNKPRDNVKYYSAIFVQIGDTIFYLDPRFKIESPKELSEFLDRNVVYTVNEKEVSK